MTEFAKYSKVKNARFMFTVDVNDYTDPDFQAYLNGDNAVAIEDTFYRALSSGLEVVEALKLSGTIAQIAHFARTYYCIDDDWMTMSDMDVVVALAEESGMEVDEMYTHVQPDDADIY